MCGSGSRRWYPIRALRAYVAYLDVIEPGDFVLSRTEVRKAQDALKEFIQLNAYLLHVNANRTPPMFLFGVVVMKMHFLYHTIADLEFFNPRRYWVYLGACKTLAHLLNAWWVGAL